MKRNALIACVAALAGSCGSDAPAQRAAGLFDLSAIAAGSSADFYALPFPNNLRLTADGHVDLSQYPRVNDYLKTYIFDVISKKTKGFSPNAPIFVRFSNPIDPATLPASADASLTAGASVYLVDVDRASPEYGKRRPLRFRFEPVAAESIGPNWLSCLPYPGFPMRESTTYALVVTTRLLGTDGTPIGRSADFDALMLASPSDRSAAATVYRPLLDYLDEPGGDERYDVALATVFTTQDTTSIMKKLRQVVYSSVPAPSGAGVVRGTPTTSYVPFEGTFSGPNFQTGDPPYTGFGGEIVLDQDGMPIVQRTESALRFAATVPPCPASSCTWPIVIYAHGTGGDYKSFIRDGTAARMAAQGLATISMDQVLHGPRVPAGTDPSLFFNFYNTLAAPGNVQQGAADDFQLLRLTRTLALSDGSKTHRFDAERIYFMGHSQGGLTGVPFLAYEPYVKGAVLSGSGALIIEALLHKTEPVDITLFVQTIDRDYPLDEFDPILAMVQLYIDPADGINYAPLLLREPPPGVGAKDIFQSDGIVDHEAPPPGIEALGIAIGLQPVSPMVYDVPGFALRGLTPRPAPITANLNGHTGVFVQYDVRPDGEGHFVCFNVPAAQKQHAAFLGTLAAASPTGAATLVSP